MQSLEESKNMSDEEEDPAPKRVFAERVRKESVGLS